MPVLEVDGKRGSQSIPICRYLAKQYGLMADNDWDNFQIDAAADAISDLRLVIKDYYYEENEPRKKGMKEKLMNETVPIVFSRLEYMVKNNGGYLAGGKLTWADLYVVALLDLFDHDLQFNISRDYPNVAALRDKDTSIPAIKDWIAKRPVTDRNRNSLTEMASKYNLLYFPLKVIAEPVRFILAYAGADYKDIRIEWSDWPRHKPDMPFGTLPVLEADGKKSGQSIPICRYLAKQHGLLADNDWDNLQIDATVDVLNDLGMLIKECYFEENESRKKELKEKLVAEKVPFCLSKLEEVVENNGGYIVGGKLTWGDLYLAAIMELFDHDLGYDTTKDYPHVAALRNKVVNIPSIKAWIAKRPNTER